MQLTALGDGFYRWSSPSVTWKSRSCSPCCTAAAQKAGIPFDPADTTYYVGHETIVVKDEATINRIPEAIFSYLNRNAVHEERRYGMPLDQVVEIGTQIDI